MSASVGDTADPFVVGGDWRRSALVAAIPAALAAYAMARGRWSFAAVLLVVVAAAGLRALQAARTSIVFDGARREVRLRRPIGAPRVIAFDAVRGVRVTPLGRGFQFGVELVTTDGATIELLETGVVGIAKQLASRLSTQFGFAPIVELE